MAPSISATKRLQQDYGVVFDYPNLSLHSASANANLGLVKYALSNGQPANSVLNGVLPIHAAAAGGHEDVVRMLIENGANVDAPRLPRKYMTDKTRSGTFTLGTAGSTPLHFAAANGHIGVIELLLACGARPDGVEKLGKTPEALAIEQGHFDAAELLRTASLNFHEGALGGQDDDDASSVTTSRSRAHQKQADRPHSSAGLSRGGGLTHSPSSSSLRSARTTQSALIGHRHLLASRRSSESLASQAAAAIRERMARSSSAKRLTLPHNEDEHDSGQLTAPHAIRRPSLPAVFDRNAAQSLRNALGMSSIHASTSSLSRPPPLNLDTSADSSAGRRRQGSGSSRSLANVFTRQNHHSALRDDDDTSTIGSPTTPFSPISEDGAFSLPRSGSETFLVPHNGFFNQPQTAPAHQSMFAAPDEAATGSLAHSVSAGSLATTSAGYRPRKSSGLAAEDAEADDGTDALAHRRASSSASAKAKTFFGRLSRASSSRSSFSAKATSPKLELALAVPDASDTETPDGASELGDQFAADMPPSRPRVPGRSRGDSVGSNSSSASRSYAPSPLGGGSTDHLHPNEMADRQPLTRTRAHRSSSTATDPDLRQVVLGNAVLGSSSTNASLLSGSPGSASSAEPTSTHSAHSTAPSSAIWSSASNRSPKGPPRTPTGELITPAQASSMVKRAEQQLLNFDTTSEASSRPSLSEQLAAYGESLALERQVKRAAQREQQRVGPATAAPMPYSWEKLSKDGTRTPVSRSERLSQQTPSLALRKPGTAFQQGPLDRRRLPTPTLRKDLRSLSGDGSASGSDQGHGHHLPHSSLRYEAVHTPKPEIRHDPFAAAAPLRAHEQQQPRAASLSSDKEAGQRQSPNSTLLSPPKEVDRHRRRSEDRRSKTPDGPGSAQSSNVEPPRSPLPSHALLAHVNGQKLRPIKSTTPQEIRAEAEELELERTHSTMSMKHATPVAPLTIENQSRDGGKLKRFVNLLARK